MTNTTELPHPAAHLVQDFIEDDKSDAVELGLMRIAFEHWALSRYGAIHNAERRRDVTVFTAGWMAAIDFSASLKTEFAAALKSADSAKSGSMP